MGQKMSLLRMLREGNPIDVNQGTFGQSGGAAYWEDWVDRIVLATGAVKYQLFNIPQNTAPRTPNDTNTIATQVPQGERWDLYGLRWFIQRADGAPFVVADKTGINLFLQNAYYVIKFNSQIVRQIPLWSHLGSQLSQETAVSTTLALQSPLPRRMEWNDQWPEECYLPLQSNITMSFEINCTATPAAVNTFLFGAAFDRLKATQTP